MIICYRPLPAMGKWLLVILRLAFHCQQVYKRQVRHSPPLCNLMCPNTAEWSLGYHGSVRHWFLRDTPWQGNATCTMSVLRRCFTIVQELRFCLFDSKALPYSTKCVDGRHTCPARSCVCDSRLRKFYRKCLDDGYAW